MQRSAHTPHWLQTIVFQIMLNYIKRNAVFPQQTNKQIHTYKRTKIYLYIYIDLCVHLNRKQKNSESYSKHFVIVVAGEVARTTRKNTCWQLFVLFLFIYFFSFL